VDRLPLRKLVKTGVGLGTKPWAMAGDGGQWLVHDPGKRASDQTGLGIFKERQPNRQATVTDAACIILASLGVFC
jgi:hypothetical protein